MSAREDGDGGEVGAADAAGEVFGGAAVSGATKRYQRGNSFDVLATVDFCEGLANSGDVAIEIVLSTVVSGQTSSSDHAGN